MNSNKACKVRIIQYNIRQNKNIGITHLNLRMLL